MQDDQDSMSQSLIRKNPRSIEFEEFQGPVPKFQPKFVETGPDIKISRLQLIKNQDQQLQESPESKKNPEENKEDSNRFSKKISDQFSKKIREQKKEDPNSIKYFMPLDQLEKHLKTDFEGGLTTSAAGQHLQAFGSNIIEQKGISFIQGFIKQINLFTMILLFAAFISLAQGIIQTLDQDPSLVIPDFKTQFILSVILFIGVITTTSLQFYQSRKSIQLIDTFRANIPAKCYVVRNFQSIEIKTNILVPGDIVEIKEGYAIPADLRMIRSNDMKYFMIFYLLVDNSLLTDNPDPVSITIDAINKGNLLDSSHIAFFGAICKEGSGRGVVITTGQDTAIGQLNFISKQRLDKKSSLQRELFEFQLFMTLFLLIFAIISLMVIFINDDISFFEVSLLWVIMIIGFIPQGLQVSIAISLQMAMRRLAKLDILLRDTSSVEALSETTCICIPLQGVITVSKFDVHNLFYNGHDYHAKEFKSTQTGKFHINEIFAQIHKCCMLTSEHQYFKPNQQIQRKNSVLQKLGGMGLTQSNLIDEDFMLSTNATERAMIQFFTHFQDPSVLIKETEYAKSHNGIQFKVPFNSTRKYSLAVVKDNQGSVEKGFFTVYIKGSSQLIWDMCTKMWKDNKLVESKDEMNYQRSYDNMSKSSKRMVGLAYKKLPSDSYPQNYVFNISGECYDFNLRDFIFLGTVSLNCQLRHGVREVLQEIQTLGIKLVIMQDKAFIKQISTGENAQTAQSILNSCGLQSNAQYKETRDLYIDFEQSSDNNVTKFNSSEDKLTNWCQGIDPIIFTSMDPNQKFLIVKACQTLGFKVAVTGDKVKDIISFKYADVSVASLFTSSHPCIEACDVTLTHQKDSFLALLPAIIESRRSMDNIIKSILFTLTSTSAKIISLVFFNICGIPLPLNEISMITVSILTDLLIAIGFAREESESTIHNKRQRTKKIMTRKTFILSFALLGVIEGAAVMFTFLTTMMAFGFNFESLVFTRYYQGYQSQSDYKFDANSPTLGNQILNFSKSETVVCVPGTDYTYTNGFQVNLLIDTVKFVWGNETQDLWDQRQVFVKCGVCTKEQQATYSGTSCWYVKVIINYRNPSQKYREDCFQSNSDFSYGKDKDKYCYKGGAVVYAQTASFVSLVICQCLNYFALRTQHTSFMYTKFNKLAMSGIIVSILCLPSIIYVPGISFIFATTKIPWYLFGIAGLPFAMLLLIVEEARKKFLPNL